MGNNRGHHQTPAAQYYHGSGVISVSFRKFCPRSGLTRGLPDGSFCQTPSRQRRISWIMLLAAGCYRLSFPGGRELPAHQKVSNHLNQLAGQADKIFGDKMGTSSGSAGISSGRDIRRTTPTCQRWRCGAAVHGNIIDLAGSRTSLPWCGSSEMDRAARRGGAALVVVLVDANSFLGR